MEELLGIQWFDAEDFIKLIFKLVVDCVFLLGIIRLAFYRNNRDSEYFFTFFLFNILTFFICVLLRKVPMEMGFALGLFAVFGILRYRTEALPIKEMTYLFITIGIAMINALTNKSISFIELIFVNSFILALTVGIEVFWFKNHERSKLVTYEKIDLIVPEKRDELIADLKQRTGLDVKRVSVGDIDFIRDSAVLKVYYSEHKK